MRFQGTIRTLYISNFTINIVLNKTSNEVSTIGVIQKQIEIPLSDTLMDANVQSHHISNKISNAFIQFISTRSSMTSTDVAKFHSNKNPNCCD